jgi:hypothetical protein
MSKVTGSNVVIVAGAAVAAVVAGKVIKKQMNNGKAKK